MLLYLEMINIFVFVLKKELIYSVLILIFIIFAFVNSSNLYRLIILFACLRDKWHVKYECYGCNIMFV